MLVGHAARVRQRTTCTEPLQGASGSEVRGEADPASRDSLLPGSRQPKRARRRAAEHLAKLPVIAGASHRRGPLAAKAKLWPSCEGAWRRAVRGRPEIALRRSPRAPEKSRSMRGGTSTPSPPATAVQ